jgi:hypothetical protein
VTSGRKDAFLWARRDSNPGPRGHGSPSSS